MPNNKSTSRSGRSSKPTCRSSLATSCLLTISLILILKGACNLISGVTSCVVGSEQIVCTTDRQGWYVDSLKLVALERRNDDGFVQQSVSALRDGQNVIQDDLDAFLLVR